MFEQVLHWGYGTAWGALYGVAPLLSSSAGLPFGIAFTLIGDEAMNTFAKLTPPTQEFPIDAHVRGLVAHIAWTATAEGIIEVLEFVSEEA